MVKGKTKRFETLNKEQADKINPKITVFNKDGSIRTPEQAEAEKQAFRSRVPVPGSSATTAAEIQARQDPEILFQQEKKRFLAGTPTETPQGVTPKTSTQTQSIPQTTQLTNEQIAKQSVDETTASLISFALDPLKPVTQGIQEVSQTFPEHSLRRTYADNIELFWQTQRATRSFA